MIYRKQLPSLFVLFALKCIIWLLDEKHHQNVRAQSDTPLEEMRKFTAIAEFPMAFSRQSF